MPGFLNYDFLWSKPVDAFYVQVLNVESISGVIALELALYICIMLYASLVFLYLNISSHNVYKIDLLQKAAFFIIQLFFLLFFQVILNLLAVCQLNTML